MKYIVFLICVCATNFVFGCTFVRTADTKNSTINEFMSSNTVVFAIAIKLEKFPETQMPLSAKYWNIEKVTWLALQIWKGKLLPGALITTETPAMGSACYATFYSYSPMRILYLKNTENDSLYLADIGGESELINEQIETLNNLNATSKPYISLDKQYPPARPTRPQLISKHPNLFVQISPVKKGAGEIGYTASIDERGQITDVTITMISASEPDLLSSETIKLIKKAKFKPATLKGVPIPSTYKGRIYWDAKK